MQGNRRMLAESGYYYLLPFQKRLKLLTGSQNRHLVCRRTAGTGNLRHADRIKETSKKRHRRVTARGISVVMLTVTMSRLPNRIAAEAGYRRIPARKCCSAKNRSISKQLQAEGSMQPWLATASTKAPPLAQKADLSIRHGTKEATSPWMWQR